MANEVDPDAWTLSRTVLSLSLPPFLPPFLPLNPKPHVLKQIISDFLSSLDPVYKAYVLLRKDAKMSYRSASPPVSFKTCLASLSFK